MYGSYGSYSSMCATRPMDIASNNFHNQDDACAFPSWPRRSSLNSEDAQRPTSFLSDDDLFLCDNPIDDDCSVSSSTSSASTSPRQQLTQAELMEMDRERMALQRALVRQNLMEQERRKQARRTARKQGEKKSSPKSKRSTNMAPIAE